MLDKLQAKMNELACDKFKGITGEQLFNAQSPRYEEQLYYWYYLPSPIDLSDQSTEDPAVINGARIIKAKVESTLPFPPKPVETAKSTKLEGV